MHELLRHLPSGGRVLDLGSRTGSFSSESCPAALVVRVDLERPGDKDKGFVQAGAARLPFASGCFDAIVSNHSLEHMQELASVLAEIGRVVKPGGALYVSVPDASTFSDWLYRWVYHGGGHVNPFRSREELASVITSATSLELMASRDLATLFGFLERRYFRPRPPRRMWLFANGNRAVVVWIGYLARRLDRFFGTRWSAYGWAMYFGRLEEPVGRAVWRNVCVTCGSGFPADVLLQTGCVRRYLLWQSYSCPECGGWNLFTRDWG